MPLRDLSDAVVSEMFGFDDEDDDLDFGLDDDGYDDEFGAWSSRAPSPNTLNAARAFASSIGAGDDQVSQVSTGDPVGHWLIDFRPGPDLDRLRTTANTIANRYQVQWLHLDDQSGQVHFWLFLPR